MNNTSINPIRMHHIRSAAVACLLPLCTTAQQRVDIQLLSANDGTVQLLIVPQQDVEGLVSNLVLTLAWDSTHTAQEPQLSQTAEQGQVLPLAASGPVFHVGPIKYRKYTGVGLVPIQRTTTRLRAGQSFCLARIDREDVIIANHPWLRERRHNGAYYISVNGLDVTGIVGTSQSGEAVLHDPELVISPNPYTGGPLQYTLTVQETGPVQIELFTAQGKRIDGWAIPMIPGTNTGTITPPPIASGQYTLRVATPGKSTSVPLVVTER